MWSFFLSKHLEFRQIYDIADILWLGKEARINIPGKVLDTNWSWRASSEMLTPELAEKLNLLVKNFE